MRTKNYFLTLIGLTIILAQLLISCGTTDKVTSCYPFQKRKYNKGYHVNLALFNKKTKKVESYENVAAKESEADNRSSHELVSNDYNQVQSYDSEPNDETLIASTENIIVVPKPAFSQSLDNKFVEYNASIKTIKDSRKDIRKTVKEVKQQLKKEAKKNAASSGPGGKSQLVALLLCIFIGGLGIHRFYLGYTGIGIIQLLTLGGCGIWSLIDLIRIITGDLKPKDGDYSETL